MRRIAMVIAGLALSLSLVGCGISSGGSPESDSEAGEQSQYLYERTITLKDGRKVTCVVWSGGNQGGVSCDWGNAKLR